MNNTLNSNWCEWGSGEVGVPTIVASKSVCSFSAEKIFSSIDFHYLGLKYSHFT